MHASSQRLQRFSTYGHLKQIVLKMIVDEISAEDGAKIAIKAAAQSGVSPSLVAGLQVRDEEEITYSLQCDGVFHQSEFLACAGSFPLT